MKIFIALSLWGLLSISGSAQTRGTFRSHDGAFRFTYSSALIRCEPSRTEAGLWVPEACLCDDEGSSVTTLACIAYPKLADKPEFNAASFLVAEVPPTTSRACLAGSKNWLTRSSQTVTINSTHFTQFFVSDAWTSHRQYGEIYRVFHAWKCYELAIQEVTTAHGAYNPGTIQEFTKEDSDEVLARLREALTSFTFLK